MSFLKIIAIIIVICAAPLYLGGKHFMRTYTASACDQSYVLTALTKDLEKATGPQGLNVRRVKQTAGGYFTKSRSCTAFVSMTGVAVPATMQKWRRVTYSIVANADLGRSVVTPLYQEVQ
jgi:hypothetical protein